MYQTFKLSKFPLWLSHFLANLCFNLSDIWIFAPNMVCVIMSQSAVNSNFRNSKYWKIKNLLAEPVLENRNCFVFSEKTFIKVLSRSFHKFFWWQGFAFTCFLFSVGLLIVLLLLLPLVVLAPYEKVFFMLFSKKRGGVLSCNFFSTLFYWWLETLHQKTCHPVIISPLNKS